MTKRRGFPGSTGRTAGPREATWSRTTDRESVTRAPKSKSAFFLTSTRTGRDRQERGHEYQERQNAVGDHVPLSRRAERLLRRRSRSATWPAIAVPPAKTIRANVCLAFGEKAQARRHVGMRSDELELQPGNPPEERGPERHSPGPAQEQESEHRRAHEDEPPARQAHLGARPCPGNASWKRSGAPSCRRRGTGGARRRPAPPREAPDPAGV